MLFILIEQESKVRQIKPISCHKAVTRTSYELPYDRYNLSRPAVIPYNSTLYSNGITWSLHTHCDSLYRLNTTRRTISATGHGLKKIRTTKRVSSSLPLYLEASGSTSHSLSYLKSVPDKLLQVRLLNDTVTTTEIMRSKLSH